MSAFDPKQTFQLANESTIVRQCLLVGLRLDAWAVSTSRQSKEQPSYGNSYCKNRESSEHTERVGVHECLTQSFLNTPLHCLTNL